MNEQCLLVFLDIRIDEIRLEMTTLESERVGQHL